jgi:hypothetical protein
MPANKLSRVLSIQADQLQKVSTRLQLVAEEHSLLTEPLLKISETIRSCATFLDVLVATKLRPETIGGA